MFSDGEEKVQKEDSAATKRIRRSQKRRYKHNYHLNLLTSRLGSPGYRQLSLGRRKPRTILPHCENQEHNKGIRLFYTPNHRERLDP
jgi:hypothetical protein